MRSSVLVQAPSNIALIKYMGKKTDVEALGKNLPENPSLSMTLSGLCTRLEMKPSQVPADRILEPEVSLTGQEKFLKHLSRFREQASELSSKTGILFQDLDEKVELKTENTFPHSAGIASSASSFAALTLACFYYFASDRELFREKFQNDQNLREVMAQFSRLGSGSSCRSFFGPFCAWVDEKVLPVSSKLPELTDLVLVVSNQPKEVGSTEAHARIKTSQEWVGRPGHPNRPERARARFQQMTQALEHGKFMQVSTLAHDDFIDMHELFHTAHPPWTYLTTESKEVLSGMEALALEVPDLMVTMDAGPNVHVLVPSPQAEMVRKKIQTRFPNIKILEDVASLGPEIL